MFRRLIVLSLAALACACTSTHADRSALKDPPPLTPTEQFAITVTQSPDQILLAPHADGLSRAQAAALTALVERWRDAGGGEITVKAPAGHEGEAYRATAAVEDALENRGVPPDEIQVVGYDAGPQPGAPIAVSFLNYQAQGPECGRNWKSFTASAKNRVNNNFGCATTANMAAMIANPADLLGPRPIDPSDASRRETVLTNYRNGTLTSSARDPQANGAVSTSVGQ